MRPNSGHVINYTLLQILEREPLDVIRGSRPAAGPEISPLPASMTAVSRLFTSKSRMMSFVKVSIPQSV